MYFVCGTKWGRVSEVYKAKCTGSNSGNSWLLSAQVCNLHFYLSGIDNVCGKKRQKQAFITVHQNDTHVGHQQETSQAIRVSGPTAVYQPLCQLYDYHPQLSLLFLLSTLSTGFRRGILMHPLLTK